jgi:ATP-dependent Clp protease ATP-binding subunit ClpC
MTRRLGRYTEETNAVHNLARQLTQQIGKPYQIDIEHIWLALIKDEKGIGGKILREAGIREAVLWELIKDYSPPDYSSHIEPFRSDTTDWINLYADEANLRGHRYITTGHLLLALLRQDHGTTKQVLQHFRIDLLELTNSINRAFAEWADFSDHPTTPPPMSFTEHLAENFEISLSRILMKLFPHSEI